MERRNALLKEIEKLDDFIALYRDLFGEELVRTETPVSQKVAVEKSTRAHRQKRIGKPGAVSIHDLGPQIRATLEEHRRPLKRGALLEALHARGIQLAGANQGKYLGTILWRLREAFINIEGQGYWPRDLVCLAIDYRPETPALSLPSYYKEDQT
jgi:hypothetical protein